MDSLSRGVGLEEFEPGISKELISGGKERTLWEDSPLSKAGLFLSSAKRPMMERLKLKKNAEPF